MIRCISGVLGFLVVMLAFSTTLAEEHEGETVTSLCELVSNAEKMNGREVRLTAVYYSDLHHFSFLRDEECLATVVDDGTNYEETADASVIAFSEAVSSSFPLPPPSGFQVDVSGRFVWDPNWEPPALLSAVMKPQPQGRLEIVKVWSFRSLSAQ